MKRKHGSARLEHAQRIDPDQLEPEIEELIAISRALRQKVAVTIAEFRTLQAHWLVRAPRSN